MNCFSADHQKRGSIIKQKKKLAYQKWKHKEATCLAERQFSESDSSPNANLTGSTQEVGAVTDGFGVTPPLLGSPFEALKAKSK